MLTFRTWHGGHVSPGLLAAEDIIHFLSLQARPRIHLLRDGKLVRARLADPLVQPGAFVGNDEHIRTPGTEQHLGDGGDNEQRLSQNGVE